MWDAVSSLWAEPAARKPRPVGRRDGVVAGAVLVAAAIEAFTRPVPTWRPVLVGLGAALAVAVYLRGSHPVASAVLGFGTFAVVDAAAAAMGAEPVVLYSGLAVLFLVYSLARSASGRGIAFGLVVISVTFTISVVTEGTGPQDLIGGAALLALVAVLGATVRYRSAAREHLVERARFEEREQLARELHDAVAHHVSAIAVQAQAGLALARSDSPGGATKALEVIDREAARTLAEMRSMVGALRNQRQQSDVTAGRGLADVENLAAVPDGSPPVHVELGGDLADLPPSVSTAVYRVAQESVTNALRHAHRASGIDVTVTGSVSDVQVTVRDDGARATHPPHAQGYGLIGMTERVTLLGGSITAGPETDRGWAVRAALPRTERTR